MSEKEVRALAEQYIEAIEDEDFEAWKALLTPMHPGDESLAETGFNMSTRNINGMSIRDIQGRNVNIQLRYKSGGQSDGWLQITPSGHIKYTPLKFRHPIASLQSISFLLRTREDLRRTGQSMLQTAGIPLFGYKVTGKKNDWEDAVEKIMEWLEKKRPPIRSVRTKNILSKRRFGRAVGKG